ncbi:LysM peptidoglycan-binding domain-containing protein [Hydromonas duriensis]|uniref:Murein DD-endopeptidase MepM/ murein hydrolase activator NlpD n=1 Tax=Hydromonas duriensis TaxID=1527608 RepID=A0A4R6Y479_9BURK|nr:LysM peptidoglycan-binding domain-containing protein [Hydromonas duriensis]TDR27043.1 murein DD-endopeptidase MepM/ murein hydrolase activator NlpD [Hydromonas duriensis]
MTVHIVKKGESLWKISKFYGLTVDRLASYNQLVGREAQYIRIGQKIKIPEFKTDPDTSLDIRFIGLNFKEFTPKKATLSFDDKQVVFEEKDFKDGWLIGVEIHDFAKGLKIEIFNLENEPEKIFETKSLPIGKKKLTVQSRTKQYRGDVVLKKSSGEVSETDIKSEVKNTSKATETSPVQTVESPTLAIDKPNAEVGSGSSVSNTDTPASAPQSSVKIDTQPQEGQVRTDDGVSTQYMAALLTDENLLLNSKNDAAYRQFIIAAAKAHGFTPQTLSAVINAEAAKKDGMWNAKSFNAESNAAGLTQFLASTWPEITNNPKSLANKKNKKSLDSRFDPEISIDAAALYARNNLDSLKKAGINIDSLGPEDLAKVAYLSHHEGFTGASAIIKGTPNPKRNYKKVLITQLGSKNKGKADEIIARAGGDNFKGYRLWLTGYVDKMIDVSNFMIKDVDKVKPKIKTMDQIIAILNGAPVPAPVPKAAAIKVTPPPTPNNDASKISSAGWSEPLDEMKLRTKGGLASPLSATFGMVRDGGAKPHQGIDLEAKPGTKVRAVAHGHITVVDNRATTGTYGNTIILSVNINDLPEKQKQAFISQAPAGKTVAHFFFAHLSTFEVEKNEVSFVEPGTVIGTTGCTGTTAVGMSTIERGAHLHFEVRYEPGIFAGGLNFRINPKDFINCKYPDGFRP